jgi:ligand-binding sensor domain-containing protein
MKKNNIGRSILGQFIFCTFLLVFLAIIVPLPNHETRWTFNWENIPEENRRDFVPFKCMTIAENGDLWAGNANGVVHISGQTVETYSSSILHDIWDIEVDQNGNVWVTTWKSGVLRFDGNNWQQIPGNELHEITITTDNTIWGIDNKNLYFFDGKQWVQKKLTTNKAAEELHICGITSDTSGGLWAGGCPSDIVLFHITKDKVEQSTLIYGISLIGKVETYNGNPVWLLNMGMKAGITYFGYFQDGKWILIDNSQLYSPWINISYITDLSADPLGNAWITTLNGVCRFNGHFCINYLKGEPVYSVATAPDGSVWLGLENQIVRLSR